MDVMASSLRGMGISLLPMVVSLAGACLLRLVWLSTVFQIPAYHCIQTVYVSYPITWIITSAAHLVCFLAVMRRVQRHFDLEGTPAGQQEISCGQEEAQIV